MKKSIIVLLLCMSLPLLAINEDAGTTGFSFLKLHFAARQAAMGYAFAGLADDANTAFFNPAGLRQIRTHMASATYMNYFDDTQCGSAVVTHPYDEKTTLAFSVKGLYAKEDRTVVDANGQYDPAASSGTFGVSDVVIALSAGRWMSEILDVGASVKFISESLDEHTATAVAADISLLHQSTNEHIKVGLALQNLGTQLTHYTETEYDESLPLTFVGGLSYRFDEKLVGMVDAYRPFDQDFSFRLGAEFLLYPSFALRAGYKTNADDWKSGGDSELLSGISVGAGFDIPRSQMKLDYAAASYGDLGLVNQITLTYQF